MSAVAAAVRRSRAVARIVVGEGALADLPALYARHFGGPALVVADENTWAAAGREAAERLSVDFAERWVGRGVDTVDTLVLPAAPRPKPTEALAARIRERMGEATPIAVGSGTINDVVKRAAHLAGRPYIAVATAASMDGYASAGAPLSSGGFKITVPCTAPRAILADTAVLAAAPARMNGWGFADLAAKSPAGGDWIVADALRIEPIDDVAWPLVQDNLPHWLADPDGVREGRAAALEGLFEGLTLAGLAMEFHGSSRPASGADHQIAHLWEMEGHEHEGQPVAHGAAVAIGALAVLRLYDWLLARDLAALDVDAVLAAAPSLAATRAEITQSLPPPIAERAVDETAAKHADPAARRERLALLRDVWPALRDRLAAHLPREPALRDALARAGAPTHPAQIGIAPERVRRTALAARFIRSRYTVLDLLAETDLLRQAVAEALSDAASGEGTGGR